MSIRAEGKRLALRVTTSVGVVSLAVTGVASIALWQQTVSHSSPGDTNVQDGTNQGPDGSNHGDDDGGFTRQQQVAPVTPGQGGGSHALSSGS
ncbi:hypothetical protein [Glaciihabitans sp. INWT7]|uniref:hypothetical protein n=1 Tax=Glaciihabitans sp. INWT7 TaxID=2596912 RepID=UPI001627C8AE|nr:hypothetical protein [Glaciihabitans sp. INWT7]